VLNSHQIDAALCQRGFTREFTKSYAHGFSNPLLQHHVFIKRANGDAASRPVGKAPLVLHPELAEQVQDLSDTGVGLSVEPNHYFNANLTGFPKRANQGKTETQYGLAVSVADELALDELISYLVAGQNPKDAAFGEASVVTVEAFKEAFLALEPHMTKAQRAMLLAHARAPAQCISMERLGVEGGYDNFRAANMQYGALAGKFADHLGITGLGQKTQLLAYAAQDKDDQGHWQWALRPQIFDALCELGLTESVAVDPVYIAAAIEIDNDPACRDIPETTREALVTARIGQGAYRDRILALWQGQCAVTGCAIEAVLVASHVKAWADASNEERLDEYNGLLLAASVDRLFDQGLISFDTQGHLLCRDDLPTAELVKLGLRAGSQLRFIHERHQAFMAHHRLTHGFEGA
jgi:hypothetical protein